MSAEQELKDALGTEFKAQFAQSVAQVAAGIAGVEGVCVATGSTPGGGVTGTVVPVTKFIGMDLHTYTPPVEVNVRPPHLLTRRLGRFRISSEMVQFFPEQAQQILMNCIVVRAEQRFDCDAIEYIAMCAQFRERAPGEEVPEYHALMRRDGDTVAFDRFMEAKENDTEEIQPSP